MDLLKPGTIIVDFTCTKGRYEKITGAPYYDDSHEGMYYPTIRCTKTGKEFKNKSGWNCNLIHAYLKKYPSHYQTITG